jgi:hypothetical protein
MIKKLFFIAALLMPGLAYAGNPSANLPVQIVPPQSGPPVPAPAAAAGFTQLAINSDFSLPKYATLGNWLDCAGANPPEWWQGWIGVEYGSHVPCNSTYIGQVSDDPGVPGTGPVLHMHWDNALWQGYPNIVGNMIETTDTAAHVNPGKYFTFFYEEITARAGNLGLNNGYNLWNTGADGHSIEFDGLEVSSGGTDANACVHNNVSGTVPCTFYASYPANHRGIDYTQYHTYAWRITSDGSTDAQWCTYIDNVKDTCVGISPAAGQIAGDITVATVPQLIVGNRGVNGPPPSVIGDMYVKSVKVWTCPAWSPGNPLAHCYSSSPNP